MKFFFAFCITLLITISVSSCKNKALKLSGIINDSIKANLTIYSLNDSKVFGELSIYNNESPKIKVNGILKGDSLLLKEFNGPEDKQTGLFEGELIDGVYSGFWYDVKKTKKVPFLFKSEFSDSQDKKANRIKYEFFAKNDFFPFYHGLKAIVDGRDYILFDSIDDVSNCFIYSKVLDFDNDGLDDILIGESISCGGNMTAAATLYYCTFNEKSKTFEFDEFTEYIGDPIVELWQGKWSIVVEDYGEYELLEAKSRFIIEGKKPKIFEHYKREILNARRALTAEDFDEEKNNNDGFTLIYMYYDLNFDGKKDTLQAEVWERWNIIQNISVKLSDNSTVLKIDQARRIGIMPNVSNGFINLVVDFDEVYKWNGSKYDKM